MLESKCKLGASGLNYRTSSPGLSGVYGLGFIEIVKGLGANKF